MMLRADRNKLHVKSSLLSNGRCVAIITMFLSLVFLADTKAQPGNDVEQIRGELQRLQNQLNSMQGEGNNDDPFGKRVRTVGRQRTPKPVVQDDELMIRFYDLSDVFSVAPQYPAQIAMDFQSTSSNIFPIASRNGTGNMLSGSGFGGGGGGVFNIPPQPRPQQQPQPTNMQSSLVSVESLIDAVKQTVAPDEWEDANGDASITALGNTLLISATETMHEQIADLLDLFRVHWGKLKTVSIQAYWIKADSRSVASLLQGSEENRVVGKTDRKRWQQFYDAAIEENRIAYSASLCGQNGQTLHTVSGRQRMLIVGAEPMYSFEGTRENVEDEMTELIEQSVAGIRPVRRMFQEGAAIQASPLATRGGNFVILDLHTRVNQMIASTEESKPHKVIAHGKAGDEFSVELESQPYVSYRLSTTIRCPKDEVMLAGGMTYDFAGGVQEPDLYLFVKTNIHTIDEDQSDRAIE